MRSPRSSIFALALSVGAALSLAGCPPGPGDDDDDDSASPTATSGATSSPTEATPTAGIVAIQGTILAVDATGGEAVDNALYDLCYGPMAIYLLTDPTDVQNPLDKIILNEPGPFEFRVPGRTEGYYVSVVADTHHDNILGFRDVLVEYPRNPIGVDVVDVPNVDMTLRLPLCNGACCTGGGGSGTYSYYAGDVSLDSSIQVRPIMITANDTSYMGPYSADLIYEPGPYSMYLNEAYLDETSLMAILDKDNNGLFEPSDHIGVADENPLSVGGEARFEDIHISLGPRSVQIDGSILPVYVPVTGYITFTGADPEGLFYFAISRDRPRGPIVSEGAAGGPDPFLLRAPQRTSNLWLWGVVDMNGDGVGDPATEPWGKTGPFSTTNEGVFGLELNLGGADPVTPSPIATPTEPPAQDTPTAAPPAPTAAPTDPPAGGTTPPDQATATPVTTAPPATPSPPPPGTPTAVPGTPTADPEVGRVMGTVSYDGASGAGDTLVVLVDPASGDPNEPAFIVRIPLSGEGLPAAYDVRDVLPGRYQVRGYLDVGSDDMNGPGDEDPGGWYTGTAAPGAPVEITVAGGQITGDVDFILWE